MKRRVIASLLTLVLCLTLLPAPAFAEDTGEDTPEPAATDVYVSSTAGNDSNAGTTQDTAVATLAKAVKIAPDGATIYVLSDLTMTECARFYNKNLTITSGDGGPYTVTRGDGFEAQSDTARSWYNPAMIEVQADTEGGEYGLTLKNIILDDGGKCMGTVFAQAISGEGKVDNSIYVQDAIVASNATVPCTITLGEGAILRNFGGMSAVRVTEKAKLVMESSSKIEDTTVTDRVKGPSGSVGPAGAIWVQNASVEMKAGSEISNVIGRAVYVDGGSAEISGTISGIKGDAHMWQGKDGTAIHLRNNATGTLTATGLITNVTGGGTIVNLSGSTYTMDAGSVMSDNQGNNIVAFGGANTIFMNGEITGIPGIPDIAGIKNGKYNAINLQAKSDAEDLIYCEIGATGNIHDNNVWYGSVYVQGNNIELHHYGKINNNSSSDKSGGIVLANNMTGAKVFMYDGAEVIENKSTNDGAGVMVSCGTFTMNGGEISGNIANGQAGGVYVRRGGHFIMNGGKISNNHANKYGGGVSFVAGNYGGYIPYVELNGGTISGNTMGNPDTKVSNDIGIDSSDYSYINRYLYISDDATIGNKAVYFQANSKTVTPANDSLDIKLGNASTDSNTALKNASTNDKGWANPLAAFWVQRDGAAALTLGGLTLDSELPVYVLTQKTGDDGKPASSNAPISTYAAAVDADGNVRFTLPAADVNGNGCAVAIVQPTQDFGTLTISGPETIKQNKTGGYHSVPHTVTYVTSENLSSIIAQASGEPEYSLVITADARLEGNRSFDDHSIDVTYKLPNGAFAVGDSLFASAELTVAVGENRYVIPSNVTKTKLLGLESFQVVFDWNDGSGKTETVSVTEWEALGDAMIADPSRRGYTFTGWNTQHDGKGSSFDNSTVITGPLTVYAQWSENSSGGGGDGSKTYYYFAIEKVDAQDGSVLSSAKFGLFLDGEQIATAASNRSGIAMFRVNESDYRKINAKSDLYYQELTAPEGYVVNSDEVSIEKSNLTTSWSKAEKDAETVRNYRGSTPDLLNGDDHFAYVVGYQDGCVHPNALITRAETATIFFRLLKDDVRDDNLRTSNTFADVPNDYWANTAISTMAGLGIVQGRSSTAFDPNASITRAKFAAICARFDTGKSSGTQTFSDIKGHWAQSYIERAAELGWIKGFEDGTFRPNDCITRAQAMTMINRVLNRIPEDASDLLPDMNVWPDCNPGDWFYLAVQEATNSHNYKHKAGNYETWISMKQDPDWTRYEN